MKDARLLNFPARLKLRWALRYHLENSARKTGCSIWIIAGSERPWPILQRATSHGSIRGFIQQAAVLIVLGIQKPILGTQCWPTVTYADLFLSNMFGFTLYPISFGPLDACVEVQLKWSMNETEDSGMGKNSTHFTTSHSTLQPQQCPSSTQRSYLIISGYPLGGREKMAMLSTITMGLIIDLATSETPRFSVTSGNQISVARPCT